MSQEKASVTRVLMIDDHALFRESVARVLAADPQLEIEHCRSIAAALPLLGQRTFDLVLLDHDLGGERASQFLPAARQGGFAGRVLVVTAWVSGTEARRLLQQGVAGIFLKQSPLEDLTAAIDAVMNGGNWIDKALAAREESPAGTESSAPQFNGRQRKVLRFGSVMNGIHGIISCADEERPERFSKIYLAFDEGEYYHGNNRQKDPVEAYTRPLVAKILADVSPL